MNIKVIPIYLLLLFVNAGIVSCSKVVEKSNEDIDIFDPLPAGSVQLDGFFENYIQNSILHWNKGKLPYSAFVNFFRNGRPQFALGEMWGKAVRSGSMFYRYTQDPELKEILRATVNDILTTQREDGSISCVVPSEQPDESDLWERKYVMLGLISYYESVDSDPKVLSALEKEADNIISLIGHYPKTEITDVGWSATNIGYEECHIESSTLLEPFVRLYNLTKNKDYLDFASYIVEAGGTKNYNVFENAFNNVPPYKMAGHYPKAYEMTSLFEGLVEYYKVVGGDDYKTMLLNLFHNISTQEITIIGNGGSDQPYHPYVMGEAWGNTAAEQTNPDIDRMMETCTGVTWLKLCFRLLRLTGDSQIMDYIEKYAYNGLIGAMKPTGTSFGYVNRLNGVKVDEVGWGWDFDGFNVTCCNLNGPMGLAYLPYLAVMNSTRGPVVNIYNRGQITFRTPKKHTGRLLLKSDFPIDKKIDIDLDLEHSEKFILQLRIPGWSENTVLKVNGAVIPVESGNYAQVDRKWNNGDRISLELDMRCRIVDAPHGSNRAGDHFRAVVYGPIVLARDESLDTAYGDTVEIKTDEEGYISAKREYVLDDSYNFRFSVPLINGQRMVMVDYASVNNWNNDKHICTWMPVEANKF